MITKESMSVGIIGGADGPTAIYVGVDPMIWPIVGVAVVLLAAAVIFIMKKKK